MTGLSSRMRTNRNRCAVRIGATTLIILGASGGSALGQPGPSTIEQSVAGAVATAVEIAAQRDTEARLAQAAANAALDEATTAREQAAAAQERVAALEADAAASEVERDAARQEAAALLAAAEEKEAELDQAERRADAVLAQAREAQARVAALEQDRRLLSGALIVGALALLVVGFVSWRLLRRRRRQLAESEAARRESDEQLAAVVTPAPFSCLLEGTDEDGRHVVVKIGAEQLGAPDGVVVGRNPAQAGVVLDHPEASREHFRLTAHDGNLAIQDLHSTNGTFVNGSEIDTQQATALSPGDQIGVGGAIRLTLSISQVKR